MGHTIQDPELLGRLSPGARQIVRDFVAASDPGEELARERIGPSEEHEDATSGMLNDRADVAARRQPPQEAGQRISPELLRTPMEDSSLFVGSAQRRVDSAIGWAVEATTFEQLQREGGLRAERLVMGSLSATPVPSVLARPWDDLETTI